MTVLDAATLGPSLSDLNIDHVCFVQLTKGRFTSTKLCLKGFSLGSKVMNYVTQARLGPGSSRNLLRLVSWASQASSWRKFLNKKRFGTRSSLLNA